MEIGQKLKNARTEAGQTQEQAAEALGVSRQTVSNWETGKTFPDIRCVVQMSDLYSVSLDHLLKEEDPVKQTYLEYLEESTDTVKSNEKKTKLMLTCVTLGIWALCVIVFWLLKDRDDSAGFSLAVSWTVLPILFFCVSFILGRNDYFGRAKWLAAPVFAFMYAASGSVTSVQADGFLYRSVVWPDFAKLPVGLLVALAGLGIGILIRHRNKPKQDESADSRTEKSE